MAIAPKGLLRYQVLELLSERPLSGSEIMSEIEMLTGGSWRPSPGSVYPLLSWLQDNGYIEEAPIRESGIKRYTLTEKGKQLLEELRRRKWQLKYGRAVFAPPFLGALWLRIPSRQVIELRDAVLRLMRAFYNLGMDLEAHYTEEVFKEVLKVLNETASKLEELDKKLRGK